MMVRLVRRNTAVLKGAVMAGLVTLTIAVFNPGFLFAEGGCWDDCVQQFGECKECSPPWEGENGELDHCNPTQCYYVCGSACEIG